MQNYWDAIVGSAAVTLLIGWVGKRLHLRVDSLEKDKADKADMEKVAERLLSSIQESDRKAEKRNGDLHTRINELDKTVTGYQVETAKQIGNLQGEIKRRNGH